MPLTVESASQLAVPLGDLKAYLRITRGDEDALLTSLIRAATDVAEGFLGQLLITRGADETQPVTRGWQRLGARPVRAITEVRGVPAEGAEFVLPAGSYAVDIDTAGDGWVRVDQPGAAGRVRVLYRAGLADAAAGLPDAIRHGIVRLAGEYHARREGLETQPPAAVAALWHPWRRMRLS
jgi:uncharacterized phiE125 gp8 family phage protein